MGMPASFQQPPSLSGWMLLHGGAVLYPATSVLQLLRFGLHVRVSPDSCETPINLMSVFHKFDVYLKILYIPCNL